MTDQSAPRAGRTVPGNYAHPRWSDNDEPILVGTDVRAPDGWLGFVTQVGHEELFVAPYSDGEGFDDPDEEQFAPEEVTREQ